MPNLVYFDSFVSQQQFCSILWDSWITGLLVHKQERCAAVEQHNNWSWVVDEKPVKCSCWPHNWLIRHFYLSCSRKNIKTNVRSALEINDKSLSCCFTAQLHPVLPGSAPPCPVFCLDQPIVCLSAWFYNSFSNNTCMITLKVNLFWFICVNATWIEIIKIVFMIGQLTKRTICIGLGGAWLNGVAGRGPAARETDEITVPVLVIPSFACLLIRINNKNPM